MLTGAVCWLWLAATPPSAAETADPASSTLAAVEEQDIVAALATITGSPAVLAQYRASAKTCPQPLAWVSIRRAANQPPGTARLRSGAYFSPLFDLTDAPTRIAIPYPAPYGSGRGSLTVIAIGAGAQVALSPAWQVAAQPGGATHAVTWSAAQACRPAGG